jgi:hypothetical protein
MHTITALIETAPTTGYFIDVKIAFKITPGTATDEDVDTVLLDCLLDLIHLAEGDDDDSSPSPIRPKSSIQMELDDDGLTVVTTSFSFDKKKTTKDTLGNAITCLVPMLRNAVKFHKEM